MRETAEQESDGTDFAPFQPGNENRGLRNISVEPQPSMASTGFVLSGWSSLSPSLTVQHGLLPAEVSEVQVRGPAVQLHPEEPLKLLISENADPFSTVTLRNRVTHWRSWWTVKLQTSLCFVCC